MIAKLARFVVACLLVHVSLGITHVNVKIAASIIKDLYGIRNDYLAHTTAYRNYNKGASAIKPSYTMDNVIYIQQNSR